MFLICQDQLVWSVLKPTAGHTSQSEAVDIPWRCHETLINVWYSESDMDWGWVLLALVFWICFSDAKSSSMASGGSLLVKLKPLKSGTCRSFSMSGGHFPRYFPQSPCVFGCFSSLSCWLNWPTPMFFCLNPRRCWWILSASFGICHRNWWWEHVLESPHCICIIHV